MNSQTPKMIPNPDWPTQLARIGLKATAAGLDDFLARATQKRWSPLQQLEEIVRAESEARTQRGLQARLRQARLGRFRPLADFDWNWPKKIDREAIRVIPNPADERLFASADGEQPDPNQVVFTGRLEKRKGVDVLARAIPLILAAHPAAKFTFYGHDHPSGPDGESMMEHMRQLIGSAMSAVELAHPVYRWMLPPIYRRAWVCAVPSLYESFGYTCLEAMASGSAVVASRAPVASQWAK